MLLRVHPNALRRQTISQFWWNKMSIERCQFFCKRLGKRSGNIRTAVLTQSTTNAFFFPLLAFRYVDLPSSISKFAKVTIGRSCCRVANKSYSYLGTHKLGLGRIAAKHPKWDQVICAAKMLRLRHGQAGLFENGYNYAREKKIQHEGKSDVSISD